jgi:outer membrane lipoprotein-sorting protein
MTRNTLLALLATLAVAAAPLRGQDAADPWGVLSGVRKSLVEAGATAASFTQVYVPAGFTSGETESGRLSLQLPDCLRWDYQDPYPKGFLLCGEVVHTWNLADKAGRRYRINRNREPGLDLLLLGVEDLKQRYGATAAAGAGGRIEVTLAPKGKSGELAQATLSVDPKSRRLVGVSYLDREGNRTRFDIKAYAALPRQGQFSPPQGIRWEDS